MLSTTSRSFVADMACRRLANAPSIRRLSQLTMGFNEIAAWKGEQHQASNTSTHQKPTIFDLKVNTPINKSDNWNISYAPEANASEGKVDYDHRWLFQFNRTRMLSGQLASRRNIRAQVEASAVRFPPTANTFSSLASNTPSTTTQESIFGSPRRAVEITDVPEISVLTKLYPEADEEPASNNTSEQSEESNKDEPGSSESQSNNEGGGHAGSSIRKLDHRLYDSMIGCPPWFP